MLSLLLVNKCLVQGFKKQQLELIVRLHFFVISINNYSLSQWPTKYTFIRVGPRLLIDFIGLTSDFTAKKRLKHLILALE